MVSVPDLASYDAILLNTSAGKDSQAMLHHVAGLLKERGLLERAVALHCDLGEEEWPGTKELAATQACHYGFRFEVKRRKVRSLLEEVRKRKKWPSSKQRYCTSYYKREPGLLMITQLHREKGQASATPFRLLNCYGFRAEESPARKKKKTFERYGRACTKMRDVDTWLPIHDWTLEQVWDTIEASGVPHHPAYDKGMPRLSCRFCIFAPRAALIIAGTHNPELLAKYVAVEKEIGHSFRKNLPLVDIQKAIADGETVKESELQQEWNM